MGERRHDRARHRELARPPGADEPGDGGAEHRARGAHLRRARRPGRAHRGAAPRARRLRRRPGRLPRTQQHRHLGLLLRDGPRRRDLRLAQHPAGRTRDRLHARRQRQPRARPRTGVRRARDRGRPGRARRRPRAARRGPPALQPVGGRGRVAARGPDRRAGPGRARRPGADPLHVGDHRPPQGRRAHPRQPHLEHGEPARPHRRAEHRRRAVRRTALPRHRAGPGLDADPAQGRHRRRRTQVRRRRLPRADRPPPCHLLLRGADHAADDVRAPRLGVGGPVVAPLRDLRRLADHRGRRPGVARPRRRPAAGLRDDRGRPGRVHGPPRRGPVTPGVGRRPALLHRRPARRRRRDRAGAGPGRAPGARSARVRRLLEPAGGDRPGPRPRAGTAPATSSGSRTTAGRTSSTGSRT